MKAWMSAALLMLGVGCAPLGFETRVRGETVVPGDPLPISLTSLQWGSFSSINFDETQEFQAQDVRKDEIRSVKLTSFTLSVLTPDGQDLSFLDTLELFAQAGDNEDLIAYHRSLSTAGQGQTSVKFQVRDVELLPYVSAPTMSITARGSGQHPPNQTTLEAVAVFFVQLGLF